MDHYASTRCHEVVHWSGHASRLARTFGKRFGDKAYAFEELVAEIGAGLCCADLGLPNVLHDSNASYVGPWLGKIGRASCRDRVWQYVSISVVAVALKNKIRINII